MTSLMGRLVDKANIVRASFSDLEKAVIKATRHNLKGPKEKHVRRLVVSTFEQPGKNQELIGLLAKRLEIVDWITVMKTLEVFHRLLRDGNASFINDLKYKSSIFNLRSFKDVTSPEAHYQSIFIQKYSQYIEEKVLVFKMLSVEFERDPNVTKTFSVEDSFEKVPRLQSQLNALLNCRASKNHINNPIIVYGFTLLLKDSFKLYRALNDSIINLLEQYFSMGKANAAKALEIYKLFTKETDGIIQFFDITRKFSKNDLPELQHAPTTLVEALENYLKDIEEGKTASTSSNERGKKLVQQFQDFRFDDASFQQEGPMHDEDSDSDDDTPHSKPPPQIPRNTANTAPSFDPFSFEDASASTDALPTFGSSTNNTNNTMNFFDDPFAAPKPVNNNNPNQFNDKKKQIEAVMTTAAYGAPLQPQPVANNNPNPNNNTMFGNNGFSSGPNYNSPFGPTPVNNNAPNNNNPFGFPQNNQPNNNNFGFSNNNQQMNTGFGYPQNNQGFNNQGGFGNTPANNNAFGFGGPQQQQQPNNNPFNPFLTNTPPPNNNTNNFNPFA